MSIVFGFLQTLLGSVVGPAFNFLNARVDADKQKHVVDAKTMESLGGAAIGASINADNQNAAIRIKEGKWSPWVVMTILGFMAPFGWHAWQVVLDSSAWHLGFGAYYLPEWNFHKVGTWRVAALPGQWSDTEHAVIKSLFIGAGAAVGAIPIIAALRSAFRK